MAKKEIVIAACAPRSYNIGGSRHNAATVRMLAGKEKDPKAIQAHVDRFLKHQLRLLHRAGGAGAEVAVTTEDCLRLGPLIAKHGDRAFCRRALDEAWERYRDGIGEVCRQYDMHVVGGTLRQEGGRYYNTATMQDPAGELIASYDKTHLPKGEAAYTTPGDSLPVFEASFGKFGLLICWDIVFPEPYAVLALQGAEIVFQPTFGHATEAADITARSRAMDWSVPLAISMWGGNAVIIDAKGEIAARTGATGDSLAVATVELRPKRQWCFFKDTRLEKPAWRRPELYGELAAKPKKPLPQR